MEPSAFPRYDISVEDVHKYGRIIDTYYTFIDSLLAELIRAAPDEATIMVVSDRGVGPTGRLPWSGGHWKTTPGASLAPDGILILSGPPILSGMAVSSIHVTDLLPTLL